MFNVENKKRSGGKAWGIVGKTFIAMGILMPIVVLATSGMTYPEIFTRSVFVGVAFVVAGVVLIKGVKREK